MWEILKENPKYEINKNGQLRRTDNKNVLQGQIYYGYKVVKLTYENSRQKQHRVHRLVAQQFIPNKDSKNKTLVNHKNGDKLDNRVENLEWVTPRENNLHYYQEIQKVKQEKRKYNSLPKPISQYDLQGHFIKNYSSISEAHREVNISVAHISRAIRKEVAQAGGFIWELQSQ